MRVDISNFFSDVKTRQPKANESTSEYILGEVGYNVNNLKKFKKTANVPTIDER